VFSNNDDDDNKLQLKPNRNNLNIKLWLKNVYFFSSVAKFYETKANGIKMIGRAEYTVLA